MLPPLSGLMRRLGAGFCYWLVFLLVLEPDNILNASATLSWSQELMRIAAAATLGALATPALLRLTARFPIEGPNWPRRAGIQLVATAAIAAVLIAVSCVLADWLLANEHRPFGIALVQELEGNGPLVWFAIAGFVAGAHALRFAKAHHAPVAEETATTNFVTRLAVKTRGRIAFVELAQVDWIEAQGNYVALHAGSETHLVRQSLSSLERQLDPDRFVRIHRRTIVALHRIGALISLGAGDAQVRLADGTELRLSRAYRERIAEHMRDSLPSMADAHC